MVKAQTMSWKGGYGGGYGKGGWGGGGGGGGYGGGGWVKQVCSRVY